MEAILLTIGFVVGGMLLLGLPKLIRRKMIIKKHFRKMGEEVMNGLRDNEILEHSKTGEYTSHGLMLPFGNEVSGNALSEIKDKGLASAEEKDGIWLMGSYSIQVRADQEKILAEYIAKRCKIIGASIID